MATRVSASAHRCTMCGGKGFLRDESFFVYGICLLACGALILFQWTPAELFVLSWRCLAALRLPAAVGTVLVFCLAAFPPMVGASSLFAWRRYGMCPQCGVWPR